MEAALNGPSGRTVLQDAVLTIGRVPDNQLVVTDAKASSHHAELRPQDEGYALTDLKSTNGTFVNEQSLQPLTPRLLQSGDVIRIGDTKFTYEVTGANPLDATVYGGPVQSEPPAYEPTVYAPPVSTSYGSNEPQNVPPPPTPAPYSQSPSGPGYPQYAPQQGAVPGYPYNPAPAQPGYVPPPQYPMQPGQMPPRKRSFRVLFIVLGIVLLVLVVSCSILAYAATRVAGASATLDTYCSNLKSKNYVNVYQQFSPKSTTRQRATQSQFTTLFSQVVNAHGGVSSCTVSNVKENGSDATGTVSYTFGDGSHEIDDSTLVNDNGTWGIMTLTARTA